MGGGRLRPQKHLLSSRTLTSQAVWAISPRPPKHGKQLVCGLHATISKCPDRVMMTGQEKPPFKARPPCSTQGDGGHALRAKGISVPSEAARVASCSRTKVGRGGGGGSPRFCLLWGAADVWGVNPKSLQLAALQGAPRSTCGLGPPHPAALWQPRLQGLAPGWRLEEGTGWGGGGTGPLPPESDVPGEGLRGLGMKRRLKEREQGKKSFSAQ